MLLQSGEAFCIIKWGMRYYKIEQVSQNGAIFITNWGRYYKAGQILLQRSIGIIKQSNHYTAGQYRNYYYLCSMFKAKTEITKEHMVLYCNCITI